ncbi:very long chain fatty acid elongase 4-like isoform X2 [Tubulanus polymorphus]|uniref:very long chain fatty acid elongase 4-like isoform X2 n=1 Tax=Tubulanus polymorphus TaxID=672921 RepID=UPI003DA21F3B
MIEIVRDKLHELIEFYDWALTRADNRVADWFLMDSYLPTILLTIGYLVTVRLGMNFMKHRKPFELRITLFIYNLALVVLNLHIFYQVLTTSWKLNYSYTCQPVDYSDNPLSVNMAKALWWYYFSKLIEFLDTIFFILRKKFNQVSFLHVYHHATMFPIWWIGVKWVPGGQSFFGAMINSFIHVIMYTYYGVSALGPQYQKYLWWKKYLTILQLLQFMMGMFYASYSLYIDCDYPRWMQWIALLYGVTIIALFCNFYKQAYHVQVPFILSFVLLLIVFFCFLYFSN